MKPLQDETIERLRQTIKELDARIADYNLLGEIKRELLACRTSPEAYQVLSHNAPLLFPEIQGALYLRTAPEHATLERVVAWGGFKQRRRVFGQDECRALHCMRAHHVENLQYNGPVCQHVSMARNVSSSCLPLLTEGTSLGVFHLQGEADLLTPWKRKMAEELANYGAMLFANLRLRELLSDQAIRDPLTGLFNRRYMEESLRREFTVRGQRSVGIIMIDIDHFGNFNKKFTHEGANELLRRFATFLQDNVRGADVACRYAGDEFLLILPGASLEATEARAETIRKQVKFLKVKHRGRPLGRITLSLGVAASGPGSHAEEVLQAAASAVGQAKAKGRDRVVVSRLRLGDRPAPCER